MGLPKHGTYTSDDGVYKITISTANESNGLITGTYESSSSPAGPLSVQLGGAFMWVHSKKAGKGGVAPFLVRFWGADRPDGHQYAINESWTGAYQTDNTMRLSGTSAYANEDGMVQSLSLGIKTFSM